MDGLQVTPKARAGLDMSASPSAKTRGGGVSTIDRAPGAFFYTGHGQAPRDPSIASRTPPPRLKPLQSAMVKSASRHAHNAGGSPSYAAPAPVPPTDVGTGDRINASLQTTWRKLQASFTSSTEHAPAHFMREITSYVERELHHISKKFPGYDEGAAGGAASPSASPLSSSSLDAPAAVVNDGAPITLLQAEGLRAVGTATLSTSERARKARLQVFVNAQRMFADSFRTYKLFLDALTDEHIAYDHFVEDTAVRYKEIAAGVTNEFNRATERQRRDLAAARSELDRTRAELATERAKLQGLRQKHQLIDAQHHSRARDNDAKRQLQESENALRQAHEAMGRLTAENESLTRQNQALTIGTFSDALESANHQLHDLRNMVAKKDDQLIEANDEITSLARDLKKIVSYHNSKAERPLTTNDVRLSNATLRVLFPEEARKQVRY
jgi:hypothetical protein